MQWLVRAGFLARAITYGVVAALALALAVGIGTGVEASSASPQGALALIVTAPLGAVAVAIIAASLLAFAVWKLALAARGRGPEGGGGHSLRDRLANLGGGVTYLAFFAIALAVVTGNTGNGAGQPKRTTHQVLGLPAGEILCAVAGVVLIAVSLYQIYDAVRGKFADDNKIEDMSLAAQRVFMAIGRVGLIARALVFLLVGYFLLRAALELHAGTAVGVDGALGRVHRQPLGSGLLALIAAGLLAFTAFSVLEARYRRL